MRALLSFIFIGIVITACILFASKNTIAEQTPSVETTSSEVKWHVYKLNDTDKSSALNLFSNKNTDLELCSDSNEPKQCGPN